MSGRQDRGARSGRRARHDQRRVYDASAGSSRQSSSTSSRFGSDTPPRFAHRQRNGGDARDGYFYEEGDRERGGGGGRGGGGYSGKGRHDRDGSGWGGGGGTRQHTSIAPKSTYGKILIESGVLM